MSHYSAIGDTISCDAPYSHWETNKGSFAIKGGFGECIRVAHLQNEVDTDYFFQGTIFYAAPIGAFFCPEICAFTDFGARFLQPTPRSLLTVKGNF